MCQERKIVDSGAITPIDPSLVEVRANPVWKDASVPRKLLSLRREVKFLLNRGKFVSYSYYPGFYSFLLSPFVLRKASVSMAHFGSDAVDTAQAAYTNAITDRMKYTGYRQAQRYVLSNTDVIYATDPLMERRYPTAADRIVESAPIIDFDISDMQSESANSCEDDPIWLLFVGVFRPVKGLEYLIDALAILRDQGSRDYRLRLVGDGRQRDTIEQKVRSMGLENQVEFTGYINGKGKLVEKYRSGDIFVISSLKESVPRVTYEAASMGLPIIATKVGGIPAFINNRADGILIESRSSEQIAQAAEEIATDNELRRQLIDNIQSKVEWYLQTDPVEQRLEFLQDRLG